MTALKKSGEKLVAEMCVDIRLEMDQDRLYLKFYGNGKLIAQDSLTLEEINTADEEYIYFWLLNAGKNIFRHMPLAGFSDMKGSCSAEVWKKISGPVNTFADILRNTNRFLSEHMHLKGIAAEYKKILFYNEGDNERVFSFFGKCSEMDPEHVLYRIVESGWDNNTRMFDSSKASFMSPHELAKFIKEEKIKKIVTVNDYYAGLVLENHRIHIMPILLFMGVELVMMDGDSYLETFVGYIRKASYSYDMFPRFSVFPYFERYYDEKFDLKNIYYVPYPHDYEDDDCSFEIRDDYSLLILSSTRFRQVVTPIYSILYLLDFLDEKRLFTELELWWLSLRWMILNEMKLNEVQRRYDEFRLGTFFYQSCLSFLKYEVIDSIRTDRKVLLYGDPPWELLFPEYYQKKYLNIQEKDEMFSEQRYLHLLMNISLFYPETHPTVNDALMRKVPFISHPHLVETPPYSGFSHIEYNDAAELNCLIKDINKSLNNVEFKTSVKNYKKVMKTSQTEMAENIMFDKALAADGGSYLRECEPNDALLNEMIQEHIKDKREFLETTFEALFVKGTAAFDVSKSRYFEKQYVQKILVEKHKS
ncbi:MAG: hypothetical protein ACLQF0_08350 [Dissulfurispiraceae bacterium]